ncbi:MAG: Phenylacetic acid degradation protein PaaD, thioesterase [Bacteroidota bacterium]|nr:Phenylacetic acid degradation protein PaaD, thioesterase [Bacteroidota bacterium]
MKEFLLRYLNKMDIEKFRHIFDKANFIRELGCELVKLEKGFCEIQLIILPKHLQQNNFVHAGVVATLADHAAGCASATVAGENITVLTTEFKINLLRPAGGEKLISRSKVLKPGEMITVCQSEVFAIKNGEEKMVAVALVSLANANSDSIA